ncbi:carbohydrate ABC transporter permease [Diplocloster agilis]|uniref:carbohydrate ABC transporter permease n=1 Tax=Diplocloster agilis TaxID=2850323 RepID=UPI001DA6BA53|nr:sugar ABC transporter permease [Diplocloster agilis]MBU9744391.1 sugar ABC transporter permease [Diplocloster agilis]
MRKKRVGIGAHLLFLGPASAVFIIAIVAPFVISIIYSFTDWNGVSNEISFIGFKNFAAILNGKSTFLESFWFTFSITFVNVILVVVTGTAAAVVLTARVPLRNMFRLALYLPNTIGGMVLGFVWQFIFVAGMPAIGEKLHMTFMQVPWLGQEETAFWALVIVFVWQNLGYVMVIMTAGFTSLSSDLLESAQIDGANGWKTFFHIKLPLVMPFITICLFWTISCAFKMFELNFSLTKGGPYGSTTSLALNIYYDAFSNNKYGLATAQSLVFFLIIVVITSVQMYLTRRKEKKWA